MGASALSSALFAAYAVAIMAGLALALLANQRTRAMRTVTVPLRVATLRSRGSVLTRAHMLTDTASGAAASTRRAKG